MLGHFCGIRSWQVEEEVFRRLKSGGGQLCIMYRTTFHSALHRGYLLVVPVGVQCFLLELLLVHRFTCRYRLLMAPLCAQWHMMDVPVDAHGYVVEVPVCVHCYLLEVSVGLQRYLLEVPVGDQFLPEQQSRGSVAHCSERGSNHSCHVNSR